MEAILVHNTIFNKTSRLVIEEEFLEYGSNDDIAILPKRFSSDQVEGFRYGVNWINGYAFTIGRTYQVELLMTNGEKLSIKLTSLYSIKKKLMHEEYAKILELLYIAYFHPKLIRYLEQYEESKILEIFGLTIHEAGIMITSNTIFTWDDLGLKIYYEYFSIFSLKDPKIHKHFSFKTEWNSHILYSLVKYLKESYDGEIGSQ